LCVERESGDSSSEAKLRKELLELGAKHPHTANIRYILFHSGFPVDVRHNSKIFREKMADWSAKRLR
jgi:hypothetical protein